MFVLLLVGPAVRADGSSRILFDFDQQPLSVDWSAIRDIRVFREELPKLDQAEPGGPAESGITISTPGNAGLYTKSGRVPADWSKFHELSFWVYRSADEAKQRPISTLEVQALEADGKTRFWRLIEISHTGWKRIAVSPRWFRWGDGRIPQWERIDRLGFWFRDAATLSIDTIGVKEGEMPGSAFLTAADLQQVAFPDAAAADVRILRKKHVELMTDAADLDLERLAEHLANVAQAVREDFTFFKRSESRPLLVIFSSREAYHAFVSRFGRALNSQAAAPRSTGYTLQGVSTSSWDKQLGTLRPVYTHEFVHGLVSREALLPNQGDWLQEGAASRYQMHFHPQQDLAKIVREGTGDERLHLPLKELCNGARIPMDRYWQAMTVLETLLSNENYRRKLPELFAAFRRSGSTDLSPHIETVLETNWEQLTADWKAHCRNEYGAAAAAK